MSAFENGITAIPMSDTCPTNIWELLEKLSPNITRNCLNDGQVLVPYIVAALAICRQCPVYSAHNCSGVTYPWGFAGVTLNQSASLPHEVIRLLQQMNASCTKHMK